MSRTIEEAVATYEQYALDAKQEKLNETYKYYSQLVAWLRELQERRAELEKTQLSQEGTTSDTISRTEVVEHLRRMLEATVPNTDYDEGYVDGVEFGISTASTMPTIQPQSTTGQLNDGARSTAQSTDLIDRQATIDAVNNAFDRETLLTGFVRSIAVRAIRDMPTVQPEPKEGHWIEEKIYRDVIECNCSECGQLMTTAATVRMNFCPNCGAKMKGERQK